MSSAGTVWLDDVRLRKTFFVLFTPFDTEKPNIYQDGLRTNIGKPHKNPVLAA
jgi:hypothetical protein